MIKESLETIKYAIWQLLSIHLLNQANFCYSDVRESLLGLPRAVSRKSMLGEAPRCGWYRLECQEINPILFSSSELNVLKGAQQEKYHHPKCWAWHKECGARVGRWLAQGLTAIPRQSPLPSSAACTSQEQSAKVHIRLPSYDGFITPISLVLSQTKLRCQVSC